MSSEIYVGEAGKARRVCSAFVGVDGVAREIVKAYVGDENGVARLCYQSFPQVGTKWEIRSDGYTYVFEQHGVQVDKFETNSVYEVLKTGLYKLEIHGGGGGGGGGCTWPGGYISVGYFSPEFVLGAGGGGSGQIFKSISLAKGSAIAVSVGKGGSGGSAGGRNGNTAESGSGTKGESSTFGDYTATGGNPGGGSDIYPNGSIWGSAGGGGKAGDSGSENNVAEDGVAARGPYTSGSGTGMIGGSGGGEYGDTYGKGGNGGDANTSVAQPGDAGADGIIVLTFLGKG